MLESELGANLGGLETVASRQMGVILTGSSPVCEDDNKGKRPNSSTECNRVYIKIFRKDDSAFNK